MSRGANSVLIGSRVLISIFSPNRRQVRRVVFRVARRLIAYKSCHFNRSFQQLHTNNNNNNKNNNNSSKPIMIAPWESHAERELELIISQTITNRKRVLVDLRAQNFETITVSDLPSAVRSLPV